MSALQLTHEEHVLLCDCVAALRAADALSMLVQSRNYYKPGPVPSRVRKTLFDLSKKCRNRAQDLQSILEGAVVT